MSINLIKDPDFKQWLSDLKNRIRQSQIKAMIKVNDEMLRLYWDLGHDIVARQMDAVWGSGFYKNLSKELKAEFPDMQGFSVTNLKYCKYFYQFYSQDKQIRRQLVDTIRPQLGDELENKILSQVGTKIQISKNKNIKIFHQVGDEFNVHPIFQIPWRHHVKIFTK